MSQILRVSLATVRDHRAFKSCFWNKQKEGGLWKCFVKNAVDAERSCGFRGSLNKYSRQNASHLGYLISWNVGVLWENRVKSSCQDAEFLVWFTPVFSLHFMLFSNHFSCSTIYRNVSASRSFWQRGGFHDTNPTPPLSFYENVPKSEVGFPNLQMGVLDEFLVVSDQQNYFIFSS